MRLACSRRTRKARLKILNRSARGRHRRRLRPERAARPSRSSPNALGLGGGAHAHLVDREQVSAYGETSGQRRCLHLARARGSVAVIDGAYECAASMTRRKGSTSSSITSRTCWNGLPELPRRRPAQRLWFARTPLPDGLGSIRGPLPRQLGIPTREPWWAKAAGRRCGTRRRGCAAQSQRRPIPDFAVWWGRAGISDASPSIPQTPDTRSCSCVHNRHRHSSWRLRPSPRRWSLSQDQRTRSLALWVSTPPTAPAQRDATRLASRCPSGPAQDG